MVLTLLVKDFRLLFHTEKKLSGRIISFIVAFLFVASFVAIEVYLFTTILKKIGNFNQAQNAFTNLFLFVISMLLIVSDLLSAYKLFFNKKDIEQLSTKPIPNSEIILSKLIFMFSTHYFTSLIFTYPIFVSYGIIGAKTMSFFYLGLFYPMVSFLFIGGCALLLVYPFLLLKKYLDKHYILRFIVSAFLMLIVTFLYSKVLNIFIEIIAGGNINSLFTTDSINKIIDLQKYQVPLSFLTEVFLENNLRHLFPYLAIAGGIFILGLSITIFAFNYTRNFSVNINTKPKKYSFKVKNVERALIKKELIMFVKNPTYMTTFTSLLIVEPVLSYLVLKALTTIFRSGVFAYYITMVPTFLDGLVILVMILFNLIISQGASNYIQMETKTIKIIKTIPVNSTRQIVLKVSIPTILSVFAMLVSNLLLLITGIISAKLFFIGSLLTLMMLFIYNAVSLKEELLIRHKKPRSSFLSTLTLYALSFLTFIIVIISSYLNVSEVFAYLFVIIIYVGCLLPTFIYLKHNMSNMFLELDVVN
jgi:hypothetical protein